MQLHGIIGYGIIGYGIFSKYHHTELYLPDPDMGNDGNVFNPDLKIFQ